MSNHHVLPSLHTQVSSSVIQALVIFQIGRNTFRSVAAEEEANHPKISSGLLLYVHHCLLLFLGQVLTTTLQYLVFTLHYIQSQ